jgi:hypothetical protein
VEKLGTFPRCSFSSTTKAMSSPTMMMTFNRSFSPCSALCSRPLAYILILSCSNHALSIWLIALILCSTDCDWYEIDILAHHMPLHHPLWLASPD